MAEHLTRTELVGFIRKTLPPRALLAASRHLGTCPECVSRLPTENRFPNLWPDEEHTTHLSYEIVEQYADGTMAGPALAEVDSHLRECKACAEDVAELRQFGLGISVQRPTDRRGAQSWRERFTAWIAAPSFQIALAVTAALVVAVAVTVERRPSPVGSAARQAPDGQAVFRLSDNGRTFNVNQDGAIEASSGFSVEDRRTIAAAIRGEGPAENSPKPSTLKSLGGVVPPGRALGSGPAKGQGAVPTNAHLLLGALYQQQGRWADAEREYRLLLDANSESSLARDLWQRAQRHLDSRR